MSAAPDQDAIKFMSENFNEEKKMKTKLKTKNIKKSYTHILQYSFNISKQY